MSELKKGIIITSISFILFMVLIVLLKTVDVKDINDAKDVGLAGLNKLYCKDYNKVIDIISDVIFYTVIVFNLFLIVIMCMQMIKSKSIKGIDYKFYIYFGILAIALGLWLLFDNVIKINTRPFIIDGKIEGSFPSTHVFLTTYIMLASPYLFLNMDGKKGLENNSKLGKEEIITIIFLVIVLIMTILRLYSGMHFLTDCIGGLFLGSFLFGLYYLIVVLIRSKKSLE